MKREFIINIILLLLVNFLIKPVYIFGIDARVQHLVGTESYGTYFAYFNFVFLFQFINDPGLQNWNAQHVPKNRETVGLYFNSLLKIKLIFGLLFTIIALVASFGMGYTDQKIILFLCLNMFLSTLFIFLRGTIAGMGYYRVDSLLSVCDKVLMILIIGYFVWLSSHQHQFDISTFIYGQGIAYFLSCIIALLFLFSKLDIRSHKLTLEYIKDVVKWSSPYILVLILMTSYNRLDGVMLGKMLDDNNFQAGVYATAFRFYDAANMIGYLFAALLLPMFAANIHDLEILKNLKEIGLRYVVISAVLIIISILFYGKDMLTMLFDNITEEFVMVLYILMLSYFMVAIAYIFGTLLVAAGKIKKLNIVFGIGLLTNIILNLLLIPKYQAIGAAAATLATQTLVLVGQVLLVKSELNIANKAEEYVKPFLFIILSIIVFYTCSHLFLLNWIYNLAFSSIICLLLSFVFKIVDKQEVVSLFRREKM